MAKVVEVPVDVPVDLDVEVKEGKDGKDMAGGTGGTGGGVKRKRKDGESGGSGGGLLEEGPRAIRAKKNPTTAPGAHVKMTRASKRGKRES